MTLLLPAVASGAPTLAWTFPSDLPARRRFFDPCVFAHPAKLHLGLLQKLIDLYTAPGDTILDPMAGTGSLMLAATQMRDVILRDLEGEYVSMMFKSASVARSQAGLFAGLIDIDRANAKELKCAPFQYIITSPPYGCRTQDSGSWTSRKERLKHITHDSRWFRAQTDGAAAHAGFRYENGSGENIGLTSGINYWRDMTAIYERCSMFLPPAGKMILILKNHYRRGALIDVVSQTIAVVEALGLSLMARHARYIDNPSLWQRRRREQGLPIVDREDVRASGAAMTATGAKRLRHFYKFARKTGAERDGTECCAK